MWRAARTADGILELSTAMHAASFAYLKDARHIELLARDLMRSKLEETLNSDVDSECASASIGRQEAEKCFVGGCIELFAGSSPSTQQAVWRLFESDLKQRKVSGGGATTQVPWP